jgi:hypothetical protein
LTFDTDALTATATKVVQLVIAGITLSSVDEILNLSSILTFFAAATPGATAASILTASGLTGTVTASGTFDNWHTLVDTANKSLMFVSSRLGVNESTLTFTLADTASSPVDLSSHAAIVNTALSSAVVHGILATDADTTGAIKSVPVYTEAEFYADFPALFVEPDSEDFMVNGELPDMAAMACTTLKLCPQRFWEQDLNVITPLALWFLKLWLKLELLLTYFGESKWLYLLSARLTKQPYSPWLLCVIGNTLTQRILLWTF